MTTACSDFSAARVRRASTRAARGSGSTTSMSSSATMWSSSASTRSCRRRSPALVQLRQEGRIGAVGLTRPPAEGLPGGERPRPGGDGGRHPLLLPLRAQRHDAPLAPAVFRGARDRGDQCGATGMGLLSERPAPSWHPASAEIIAGCRRAAEFCRARGGRHRQAGHSVRGRASRHRDPRWSARPVPTTCGRTSPMRTSRSIPPSLAEVLAVLRPIQDHNFTRGLPENRDPLFPLGCWNFSSANPRTSVLHRFPL